MEPRKDDVAPFDADLGDDLGGGRALEHGDARALHRCEQAGVAVAAQAVAPVEGGAVDDAHAGGPGGADELGHIRDESGFAGRGRQLGQRRRVADDAPLHLGGDHRRVGRGDELGQVDGHVRALRR